MKTIKCLLADDEPIARQILEQYIGQIPYLSLVKSCSDAFQVIEILQSEKIDLVFLDINMPKLSGLSLIKSMPSPSPEIIITTAYSNHAIEGFELSVTDYLLKPFSFERFLNAVLKTQSQQKKNTDKSNKEDKVAKESIFVKSDKKLVNLNFAAIYFIEAYGNYIKIHTNETILVSETLSSFIQKLPSFFVRTHKSYCVNIQKIKLIDGNQISLTNGEKILIGNTHRKELLDKIESM